MTISLYSLAFYLWKMLVPLDLSPLYELPAQIDPTAWPYLVAGVVVAAMTACAVALRQRWPALLAVWVIYIVILLPVLGIVQNGPQIAADRYTYLASLGWGLLAGAGVRFWWGARDARWLGAPGTLTAAALAVGIIGGPGVLTWKQVDIWRDSESLWTHAIAVRPSPIARNNMGMVRQLQGRLDEAAEQFRLILAVRPGNATAHLNLGVTLARASQLDEAMEHFRRALELRPNYAKAHNNLAGALLQRGRMEEAIEHLRQALAIAPNDASTHNNLGYALNRQGLSAEASQHFQEALRLQPGFPEPRGSVEEMTKTGGSSAR